MRRTGLGQLLPLRLLSSSPPPLLLLYSLPLPAAAPAAREESPPKSGAPALPPSPDTSGLTLDQEKAKVTLRVRAAARLSKVTPPVPWSRVTLSAWRL